ncbi:cilia- and flagella-associated protein 299 [Drosophila persimilis]|nr:cilia- and flagella-associated protein 299 [Drosophila persimilis]
MSYDSSTSTPDGWGGPRPSFTLSVGSRSLGAPMPSLASVFGSDSHWYNMVTLSGSRSGSSSRGTVGKSIPSWISGLRSKRPSITRLIQKNYENAVDFRSVESKLDISTLSHISLPMEKPSETLAKKERLMAETVAKYDYEDYLNTFVKLEDRRYLTSERVMQMLVPFRVIPGKILLSESKFQMEQAKGPLGAHYILTQNTIANDPLAIALAEREKLNAVKEISSIIFISTRDSKGFSISGYIDYEQSLRHCKLGYSSAHDWVNIFAGNKRLEPNENDLSFITWKTGKVFYNNSDNYKIIPDAMKGLCFQHKGDGCVILIEKRMTEDNPKCSFVESAKNGSIIIYDHKIRRKN